VPRVEVRVAAVTRDLLFMRRATLLVKLSHLPISVHTLPGKIKTYIFAVIHKT